MRMRLNRGGARRMAWALAALILTASLYDGYGPASARDLPAPPLHCDAAGAGAGEPMVRGQIRYDSGASLRYCSLRAMFAQLAAQEQPGLVRSAQVLTVDGRWVEADQARYRRGAPAWWAYHGSVLPLAAQLHSYRELLQACARRSCLHD